MQHSPQNYLPFITLCLGSLLATPLLAQNEWQQREDWATTFAQFDSSGTLLMLDQRGEQQQWLVHNTTRATQQFSPASTFKIPHTLMALDAGVVHDEVQRFNWDGQERGIPAHNRDQNLRTAMRHSAVWVYAQLAQTIGNAAASGYLRKIDYGNANPHVTDGNYWVDGALAISAQEQVEFLGRLYSNQLPFAEHHQRLVKDIIIVEANSTYLLRAKTGWSGSIGWWVGWFEFEDGPLFFALNIDTPKRMEDLYKREAIVRAIVLGE